MLTVKEVSKISGVSIRALHHYDSIGLLKPCKVTEAGYRLYSEKELEILQRILLYKELEFSLTDIKNILNNPLYDSDTALDLQIEMLEKKKQHIENLLSFAIGIKSLGVDSMSFKVFDEKKLEMYKNKAKENWGETEEYKEFEEKNSGNSKEKNDALAVGLMNIFSQFGKMKDMPANCEQVQNKVMELQCYISDNYYKCSNEILYSLSLMYIAGDEMTENIDNAGGEGTARFVYEAIGAYIADSRSTGSQLEV